MESECIICKGTGDGPFSVASAKSLGNIKSFCEDWSKLGKHIDVLGRVKELTYSDDIQYSYHRRCYQSLCHHVNLTRAQKRYEEDISSAANRKRGSTNVEATSTKSRKTFDQNLCVFCQSDDKTAVHSVTSCDMGKKFLTIKSSSKCEEIRARLAFINSDKDAFAQNMKYHINCLRKETRAIESSTSSHDSNSERDNIGKAICDIEIAKIVQSIITDNSELDFPSVDMNSIHDTYKSLLEEHGVTFNSETNYKPYIKNILLEVIPEIDFAKRGPKPEIVFSTVTKDKLMAKFYESAEVRDEMEVLYNASDIIRREISQLKDWNFTGTFDDFNTPMKLQQLMKWIISGSYTNLNITRELQIDISSRNLAQHIISSYRSTRQVTYKTKTNSKFQKAKKTPLTVGLALTSYQANRSRSDVKTLNDLQIGVTYDDVERTTTRMAMAIMDDMKDNAQGAHLPPFVKHGIRPLFAIDNIDLGSDVGSFHGADLLIAQKKEDGVLNVQDKALKKSLQMAYYDCDKPADPTVSHVEYKHDTLKDISTNYQKNNIVWLLMCCEVVAQMVGPCKDDGVGINKDPVQSEDHVNHGQVDSGQANLDPVESNQKVIVLKEAEGGRSAPREISVTESSPSVASHAPDEHHSISQDASKSASHPICAAPQERASRKSPTWATFNSLISAKTPIWNVGIVAPLYRRSPREWPVLLTVLKQAQKINCITVGEGCVTIVTLDGDLYDRAVKLKDYKNNWCIRLGALHITMAALKCLGKYMCGCGDKCENMEQERPLL